jgi:hypothetical protein
MKYGTLFSALTNVASAYNNDDDKKKVHIAWKGKDGLLFLLAGSTYKQMWVNVCKTATTQPSLFINKVLPYSNVVLT